MPEGELKAYNNNGSSRWFYINGDKRVYLSRSNKDIAKKLAMKKYYLLKKQLLLEKKYKIESQSAFPCNAQKEFEDFLRNKNYCDLLGELCFNREGDWENQKYKTNPYYPEQCNVSCLSGHMVRSKSEAFIDMALVQHGIPFRYECELVLGGQAYYPDFTLRIPDTGKIIYWEHFGRMDDADYARNAFNKMKVFYDYGLIPGHNVIYTFETKNNPFTYADAEAELKIIKF
ncbi:MAG: hypothetical protein E7274_07920 [Pseudobutyrivibrio ruminis]|uniref:hypothetical protein n=1 Tax=Pseudobutyrivibrio ruminis TaxID=46206 RepID=UPI0026E9AEBA|nr:hypothetical protein [Pseudobutyrivibrio ruminis]MBE5913976.1 hypothetical protein [Pseudobutyrivibrio ruminis]